MSKNNKSILLMVCCLMVNLHTPHTLANVNLAPLNGLTTEVMYSSPVAEFTGRYASVRETLDYNYHRFYQTSRQKVQDKIIDSYLLNRFEKSCQTPTIIFMAGVMGAGKSHSLRYLDQREDFYLSDYVVIDPDRIKYQLPEMSDFIQDNPLTAGTLTHKESGHIAEIIQNEALRKHFPIIVDGSLRDKEWNQTLIESIRKNFPRYRIGLIYVTASRENLIRRIKMRQKNTGRSIHLGLLEETAKRVPITVAHLRGEVDFFLRIKNEYEPVLIEAENLPLRACWAH